MLSMLDLIPTLSRKSKDMVLGLRHGVLQGSSFGSASKNGLCGSSRQVAPADHSEPIKRAERQNREGSIAPGQQGIGAGWNNRETADSSHLNDH